MGDVVGVVGGVFGDLVGQEVVGFDEVVMGFDGLEMLLGVLSQLVGEFFDEL